jgi:GAF domain-containing protein
VIGHFLVTASTNVTYPSKERRQVAVLLADQVAAALDAE